MDKILLHCLSVMLIGCLRPAACATTNCTTSWEKAGQYCYFIDTGPSQSFACANSFCVNLGGRLPELPSANDSDEFGTWWESKKTFRNPWLGAIANGTGDRSNTSIWTWINTGSISYQDKWNTGYPINIPSFNCSYQWYVNKLWYNDACTSLRGTACQYDLAVGVKLPGNCDAGYVEISPNCYKFGTLQKYKSAYDTCAAEGSQLVEFATADELNNFTAIWRTSCDRQGSGFWIGLRSNPTGNPLYDESWEWTSGSALSFTPQWSIAYPTQFQYCASIFEIGTNYEFTNLFDCKYDVGRQTICYYAQSAKRCVKCDTGWILVGNYCYNNKIARLSYDAGKVYCEGLNGTLPIFANISEYDNFISYMRLTPELDFWLGLTPASNTTVKFDSNVATWKWLDGSALSFPFRENSLLRINLYPYACIYAEMLLARWQNNHACGTIKPIICQKSASATCLATV